MKYQELEIKSIQYEIDLEKKKIENVLIKSNINSNNTNNISNSIEENENIDLTKTTLINKNYEYEAKLLLLTDIQ